MHYLHSEKGTKERCIAIVFVRSFHEFLIHYLSLILLTNTLEQLVHELQKYFAVSHIHSLDIY